MRKAVNILRNSLIVLNVIIVIGLLLTAYSGYFNPMEYRKITVLGMAYPAFLIAALAMVFVWILFMNLKFIIIFLLPILITWDEAYTYCPLNIFDKKIEATQEKTKFTVLTYNVMDLIDFSERKLDYNPTVSYILKKDADFVCLQEFYGVKPDKAENISITQKQCDSIKSKYPYSYINKRDLGLLSKYPIESVEQISQDGEGFSCAAYKVLINDEYVTIYNVHLQSIGLTEPDKKLYYDLTKVQNAKENIDSVEENITDIKGMLYSKLSNAFTGRSFQAQKIQLYLTATRGNIILCGDFNDTPNSFAYRTVKGQMTDAYKKCGFGPMITYHANRFFFRIDHLFYKGNFEAMKLERDKEMSSDHYPTLVTFVRP